MPTMELKNASCVVTGAARGLGAALARELAARGAKVLLSDIDGSGVHELAEELGMQAEHCNVTDRDQVEALARSAIDTYGSIDLWMNNAGIWMPYAPAENIDFGKAHQLVEVNYFGLAYGMLEAMKHMHGRKRGVIANVLSVRSLKGKALGAAYSASKFAAEGFTQAVRDELKDSGITVVGIYPYRIKTALFGENKHEDYDKSMEPGDVAKIIVDNLSLERPPEHIEIWSPTDIRASHVA
ncbi:MAG TPA: SDR family NAD(P)-dependent oxidoreductase [Candidatus Paceibacterota bacterium]|nr:SDR family NAD(P)-dependent oxidoreductase [Candidatus Paceibacterota bacterium]